MKSMHSIIFLSSVFNCGIFILFVSFPLFRGSTCGPPCRQRYSTALPNEISISFNEKLTQIFHAQTRVISVISFCSILSSQTKFALLILNQIPSGKKEREREREEKREIASEIFFLFLISPRKRFEFKCKIQEDEHCDTFCTFSSLHCQIISISFKFTAKVLLPSLKVLKKRKKRRRQRQQAN